MMVNPDLDLESKSDDVIRLSPTPKPNNGNPRCKKCRHYLSNHRKEGCIVEVGLYSHKECGCMWDGEND